MTIFEVLKQEHQEIKDLFVKIENSEDEDDDLRQELFSELELNLLAHAKAEQVTVYARLEQDEEMKAIMAEAQEEHALAEKFLREIKELDVTDEEWMSKIGVLKENIEHHMEAEENEMFENAKSILSEEEQEDLAFAFQEERERLMVEIV